MAEDALVFDVAPGRFDQQVIEASREHAIVVDFWAEWCVPCRTLSPILERVVRSFEGRAGLAKVDIEHDRDVAARYGVQSIPSVKVFREGELAGEFVGALPEAQVRRILESLIPSRADELVLSADHLVEKQRLEEAEQQYGRALELQPDHSGALLRLGMMALEKGEVEEARNLLSRIEENAAEHGAAQGLLARIQFSETCQRAGGRQACERRVAGSSDNLDARYELGCCLTADGDYEPALEQFFQILSADRTYRDGAAKEGMLRIFSLVGPRSELADRYRRQMAGVLY